MFMARADGPTDGKVRSPPLVYVGGEHTSAFAMERVLACVLAPHVDTALWARFDLSLAARAASADGELARALGSGARLRAIFKEPTITPTAEQCAALGIDRLSSPNGVMRDAWRALVISRDTLAHAHAGGGGYRAPVLFDRHAVGGEYGATHATVPAGRVTLSWQPPADAPSQPPPRALCELAVSGAASCVVLYANPHDDLPALGRAFFERCLAAGVTPYVVTKRSVFKWQEAFWAAMLDVFEREGFGQRLRAAGLLERTGGRLAHLLSDSAAMAVATWLHGGFGMVAHNYDGDLLTDLLGAVHGSPALVSSVLLADVDGLVTEASLATAASPVTGPSPVTGASLVPEPSYVTEAPALEAAGKAAGSAARAPRWQARPPPIKMFEACHGTATDVWLAAGAAEAAHASGDGAERLARVRFDPTGLCHALLGAMAYACEVERARAQPALSAAELDAFARLVCDARAALNVARARAAQDDSGGLGAFIDEFARAMDEARSACAPPADGGEASA